ncbi:MAG: hypothetical protein AAF658_05745 [Myxococcota bacterium]
MKNMNYRRIALFGASLSLITQACSAPSLEETSQTRTATAVEDIRTLSVRPDGRFDVICKNGELEVRTAEEIRDDEVCVTSSPGGFICTARDGDGIAPWSVARVSGGGVTVFQNVVFSDIEDCKDGLSKRIERSADTYVCGSRDRDGINPWALYHLSTSATLLDSLIFKTLDDCFEAVDASATEESAALVCASRDRDGIAPWNAFTLSGTSVERGDEEFSQVVDCFEALEDSDDTEDASFLCVSRDNDGIAPWVLAKRVGVTITRYDHAVYNTTSSCGVALENTLVLNSGSVWVCASRDRDGINPFALVELAEDAGSPTMVYSNFGQCVDAVDEAYLDPAGALVCASRDRDGINPWSIYAVEDSGAQRTDLVYSSYNACLGALEQ